MLDLSYIIQDMKEIKYNNKVYKLPFSVSLPEDPTVEEEVSNRFNGEKVKLPAFAVAVYDMIIGGEAIATGHDEQVGESGHSFIWDEVRNGLDWFRKYFPKQYMVLLD